MMRGRCPAWSRTVVWLLGIAAVYAVNCAQQATAADLYVSPNGVDSGSRNSWSTAYTNIQDALNNVGNNDTVYLAGHTFPLSAQLVLSSHNNVTIRGGYQAAGDAVLPGPRDPAQWPTVLKRVAGTARIWYISSVTDSLIEGVTMQGGYALGSGGAGWGGGVYVSGCLNLVLSDCVITLNTAESTDWHASGQGGGLYSAGGAVLTNCVISRNRAIGNGDYYSDYGRGGGLYAAGSLTVRNCVVDQNEANNYRKPCGLGGGLYGGSGTFLLHNCLILRNRSYSLGDGAYVAGGTVRMENCTVADQADHGIYRAGGTVSVSNSIVWNNGDDVVGTVTLDHCDVQDGDQDGTNGCFSADPEFEYGYYLGTDSLCVNAGSKTAASAGLGGWTTRADGQTDQDAVDLGYHYSAGYDFTYADLYVAPAPVGNDANGGTNAAQPLATIGKAIELSQDGTRIHIGTGTYENASETFPLTVDGKTGLQFLGTNREATVVNAAGSNKRVFSLRSAPSTLIEGLFVTGGRAIGSGHGGYGGGVYADNCAGVVVSDCIVSNNTSEPSAPDWHVPGCGGGIFAGNGWMTVAGSVVVRNTSYGRGDYGNDVGRGGGVYGADELTVRECVLERNVAYNVNTFAHVGQGGGVFGGGTVLLRSCLLLKNVSWTSGDAVFVGWGTLRMENCTVVDHADDGVYRSGGSVWVENSILWDNGDDVVGSVDLSYSDIEDGDSDGTNDCISVYPDFEDPGSDNYRLQKNSFCIDVGTNHTWMIKSKDLDGGPRVFVKRVDMGAYESPHSYLPGYLMILK